MSTAATKSNDAASIKETKRANTPSRVRFQPRQEFSRALKERVDAYFKEKNLSKVDSPWLYLKTFVIFAWCIASYITLLFVSLPVWGTALVVISLGLAMTGIGFNVMHDGGHKAFSKSKTVNKVTAFALDVLGGSSYFWHWKHNYLHHSFTNLDGYDDDLNVGVIARLAPQQESRWHHRFQQFYMWGLYGLLPAKWHLVDDFRTYLNSKIMEQPIPRPKGADLFLFVLGKAIFFTLAFIIPSFFYPLLTVFAFYMMATFVEGVVLAVTFQMAHCVEEAAFPDKAPGTDLVENEWCIHQVETTVNFARHNRLLSWYVGGLNFQVEHHLFPKISHVHYPAISEIVKKTCEDFGVRYRENITIASSLASHFRLLRFLGRPEAA